MEEIKEIQDRLTACFQGNQRLAFWEDEGCEYADIVGSLQVPGAAVVDATGCELATKRRILRGEPDCRFVIYRKGGAPECTEDFLYDLKLAAVPFTCSMEGIWADECGIAPNLAPALNEHARFFASKQRKAALSVTELPKSTPEELRFAILAATFGYVGQSRRDAARAMAAKAVLEHVRGDEATMRLVSESGLAQAFWSAMREFFRYDVPAGGQPSVGDLAFRMVATACASLMPQEVGLLSNDAVRVFEDMGKNPRSKEAFESLASEYREGITALIPEESRTIEALADLDALPVFDEWILAAYARDAADGRIALSSIEQVWSRRRHSVWADKYRSHYATLLAIARFEAKVAAYHAESSASTTVGELFEAYCAKWHEIDAEYRRLVAAFRRVPNGRFKNSLSECMDRVHAAYDAFLVDLTDRWQLHLMDEGSWPPANIPSQSGFFRKEVEYRFPKAARGEKVGIIVSDALRYEAGAELASRIAASARSALKGKVKAKCSSMVCMLPSYTQLGMAALLPDGPMGIDPSSLAVAKSGASTSGVDNRGRLVAQRIQGSVALKAEEITEGTADVSAAPVVLVYHNVIDKVGDSRETESKVFEAVETAFEEIECLTAELVRLGCKTVLVTSDHGFLYQGHDLEAHEYAEVEGLAQIASLDSVDTARTRRFVVGNVLPKSDVLVEYAAAELSLEGDYSVAFPKGITRLRLSGSGARYVHGGASMQENVVPLVTVESASTKEASRPAGVEAYPIGRASITGPTVSVSVRQLEPCSEAILPVTAKVGVYSAEGSLLSVEERLIELDSESSSADERTKRVTLALSDDVDDHQAVFVRVFTRISGTNSFKAEWEKEYSVSRAFGMDF